MTQCLTYDWRLAVAEARDGDPQRLGRSGVRLGPRLGWSGAAAGRRPALRGLGGQAFLPNEAILKLVGEGGGRGLAGCGVGGDGGESNSAKRTHLGGEGRGANRFAPSGCSALRGWPDMRRVGCGILRNEANLAVGWRTEAGLYFGSSLFSVEPGGGQGNSKPQFPSSKETPKPKFQPFTVPPASASARIRPLAQGLVRSGWPACAGRRLPLKFGVWNFFGIWNLGFGTSPTPIPLQTAENLYFSRNLLSINLMRMDQGWGMQRERKEEVLRNEANRGGSGNLKLEISDFKRWRNQCSEMTCEGQGQFCETKPTGETRSEHLGKRIRGRGVDGRGSRIGLLRPTDGGCQPPARGLGATVGTGGVCWVGRLGGQTLYSVARPLTLALSPDGGEGIRHGAYHGAGTWGVLSSAPAFTSSRQKSVACRQMAPLTPTLSPPPRKGEGAEFALRSSSAVSPVIIGNWNNCT